MGVVILEDAVIILNIGVIILGVEMIILDDGVIMLGFLWELLKRVLSSDGLANCTRPARSILFLSGCEGMSE